MKTFPMSLTHKILIFYKKTKKFHMMKKICCYLKKSVLLKFLLSGV